MKKQIEDYINNICNSSKDGKINEKLLNKIKNKNLIMNSINFITGFTVAAIFLSTLIPKFQYWYTKMRTGKNEFPGTYGLENS